MKKDSLYLYLSLLLLSFISCNNADDTILEATENTNPKTGEIGNFTIEVDIVNFYRVNINWNEPTNDSTNPLTYSLFLNNDLIEGNMQEKNYSLDGLEELTDYTVKVIATNNESDKNSTTTFTTPKMKEILLKKMLWENTDGHEGSITYDYNELNNITDIILGEDYYKNFTYNEKGQIINNIQRYYWSGATATYNYTDEKLTELITRTSYEYYITRTYDLTDPLNYTFQYLDADGQGPPTERNYEATLVLNSDNLPVQYNHINVETQEAYNAVFTYEGKNLIKIHQFYGGVEHTTEIEYDDKKNFMTYYNGFCAQEVYGWYYEVSGFSMIPTANLFHPLNIIPFFYNYHPENNPISYKWDGQVYASFNYEYNEYAYPSKIQTGEYLGEYIYELIYEEID